LKRFDRINKIQNYEEYVSARLGKPWSDIVILHFKVIIEEGNGYSSNICDLQNTLAQTLHTVLADQSGWLLPIVYEVNSDLQRLSTVVDNKLIIKGEKAENLEKAARTMNRAFSLCATDRFSNLEESRKWGVYRIVNLLFKTYFKLSSTNLCSNILKSLQSADLPQLNLYPKPVQITFRYYLGVLSFFNEKFEEATENLM
jgi:COP9 signalosome complex subunit 12